MKQSLTANEAYYRNIVSAVGVAMVCLLILMNGIGLLMAAAPSLLARLPIGEVWAEVIHTVDYLST